MTLRITCLLSNPHPLLQLYISTLNMVSSDSGPSENGRLASVTSHSSARTLKTGEKPMMCVDIEKGATEQRKSSLGPPFPVACKNRGSWNVEAKSTHLRARTLIVCTAQHLASYSVFFSSVCGR